MWLRIEDRIVVPERPHPSTKTGGLREEIDVDPETSIFGTHPVKRNDLKSRGKNTRGSNVSSFSHSDKRLLMDFLVVFPETVFVIVSRWSVSCDLSMLIKAVTSSTEDDDDDDDDDNKRLCTNSSAFDFSRIDLHFWQLHCSECSISNITQFANGTGETVKQFVVEEMCLVVFYIYYWEAASI